VNLDTLREGPLLIAALVAFGGGMLSFALPCVWPLVPAYLSFVSGTSIHELKGRQTAGMVRRVVGRTLAFILGFALVYTALGAAAGAVGGAISVLNSVWATRAAGALLIVMGIHLTGVLKIGALYRERRFQVTSRPASVIGAFLVGTAFAFGWSPCTGPVIAAILTLAAAQQTVGRGIFLLAAYSLGLGVPFLAAALATNLFLALSDRVKRWMGVIEIASGVLLVAVGVLLVLNQMPLLMRLVEDGLTAVKRLF
jgi:cytochrome c-type biogenesis protein